MGINMKQEHLELLDRLAEIEKAKYKSTEKKTRMDRVIDVCELNGIQNEQWIRGLTFYLTNLRKMIKATKKEIADLETDIKELTIMTTNFLGYHNNNVDKHNYILDTIKKNFERQSEIDSKVYAT